MKYELTIKILINAPSGAPRRYEEIDSGNEGESLYCKILGSADREYCSQEFQDEMGKLRGPNKKLGES